MPDFLAWAQNLSWFYYGFDLLMRNQWTKIKHLNCSSVHGPQGLPGSTSSLAVTTPLSLSDGSGEVTTGKPQNYPSGICPPNGNAVIEFLDMGNHNEVSSWAALVAIFFVLRFAGYLALAIRAKFSR